MSTVELSARFGVGLATGLAIAGVDNFAFGGEVSPIVIVGLLFAATAIFGYLWTRQAWLASTATWICPPAAHLIKHAVGLLDSLHPNTYLSILMLAAFTLAIATLGTGSGCLLRWLATGAEQHRD